MRWLFEARLVNDAFGDPGLYVDFRDERRALLFDLGDISVLPPRKLMRLSHVFVTHTHMDHFSGFDHLLRVVLGRKAKIVLFGGPDFVEQVEHKLRAYTWNVTNRRCGPAFLSKVFSWTRILSVRRARPVRSCAGWRPAVPFFTPLRRTRGSADRGGASRVVRYAGADGRKP